MSSSSAASPGTQSFLTGLVPALRSQMAEQHQADVSTAIRQQLPAATEVVALRPRASETFMSFARQGPSRREEMAQILEVYKGRSDIRQARTRSVEDLNADDYPTLVEQKSVWISQIFPLALQTIGASREQRLEPSQREHLAGILLSVFRRPRDWIQRLVRHSTPPQAIEMMSSLTRAEIPRDLQKILRDQYNQRLLDESRAAEGSQSRSRPSVRAIRDTPGPWSPQGGKGLHPPSRQTDYDRHSRPADAAPPPWRSPQTYGPPRTESRSPPAKVPSLAVTDSSSLSLIHI